MKTLMVAAGISTLLIHSPALAQESAKVLSIHNGQQLLIEVNGKAEPCAWLVCRPPAANSAPGQPAHWLSFRSWFVLVMWATSSSERGTFTAVLWAGS